MGIQRLHRLIRTYPRESVVPFALNRRHPRASVLGLIRPQIAKIGRFSPTFPQKPKKPAKNLWKPLKTH
jgi:hypothetical protein